MAQWPVRLQRLKESVNDMVRQMLQKVVAKLIVGRAHDFNGNFYETTAKAGKS